MESMSETHTMLRGEQKEPSPQRCGVPVWVAGFRTLGVDASPGARTPKSPET